ncbi:hypothetical protein J4E91_008188 [Alternaria rosae]|nr:hypothetical protein J4E91_008188 [Alternaria rosae]
MSVEDYSAARRGILQDVTNTTTTTPQPDSAPEEEPFDFKVDLVDIREKEQWGDTPLITLTPNRHQAKFGAAARYEDYILVLRRRFDETGQRLSTDLEVRSPHILRAFRIVLADYPSLNFDSAVVAIPKPYAPLFHYRKELRSYASDDTRTVVEKEHLDVLIKFMEKNLSQTEHDYSHSEPYQMVSYSLLWTLFRPEEVIIAQGDHFDECYTVDNFEYVSVVHPGTDNDLTPYFRIDVKRWDYNGTRFGMSEEKLKIREFATAVKIDTLMVYPIRFHKKEPMESLKDRLIQRGRKWREILEKSHMHYDALAWSEPPSEPAAHVDQLIPGHVSGRIMLDYKTHAQAAPRLATFLSSSGATIDYDDINPYDEEREAVVDYSMARKASDKEDKFMSHLNTPAYNISDDQALLTPARVRGYSFVEKIWAFFLVEEIKHIEWHPKAFESLELDSRMKSAILAMVSSHQNQDDFDAVAEHIKSPMYSITSGELGTDIEQTDVQLRTIFTRAKAWDAIILLDEADVFLAQRNATDLKRNAYVSGRCLQEPKESDMARLGKYELNGREIKNLLRTALAISKYEKEELSETLIRRVLDLSREHLLGDGS